MPHATTTAATIEEALCAVRARPPRWVDALPVVRLCSGVRLTDKAVSGLIAALKSEGPASLDTLPRRLRAHLDGADCAALLKTLEQRWRAAGEPSGDRRWLIFAAALLGDGAAIDRLGRRVETERRARRHKMARCCVEAICRSDQPAATAWLAHLARAAPTLPLRMCAWSALNDRGRDGPMPLALPSLGFDARGERPFDHGGRALTLRLRPGGTVAIFDGDRPLKALPTARRADDPAAVRAARARFATLKTDLAQTLTALKAALTESMVLQQPLADGAALLAHPVGFWIVRGVIWRADVDFLLTEEGVPVDIRGHDLPPPDPAALRPVHPIALSAAVRDRWSSLLVASGHRPPFPQLDRPVSRPEGPPSAALVRRPALSPWQLARNLTRRGYLPDTSGGTIERALKFVGAWLLCIEHEPYSAYRRSGRVRLLHITVSQGQRRMPRIPLTLQAELEADIAMLYT